MLFRAGAHAVRLGVALYGGLDASAQYSAPATPAPYNPIALAEVTGAPRTDVQAGQKSNRSLSQDPYLGGVPSGKLSAAPAELSLEDAVAFGLKQNLGGVLATDAIIDARGEKWQALSALLPNVVTDTGFGVHQVNINAAFGLSIHGVPPIVGPFGYFDSRAYLTQSVFDWTSIEGARSAQAQLKLLHDQGQSLWLDNITRDLLDSGTLKRYIDELSITGLTSNPTIFEHAIKNGATYDSAIRSKTRQGVSTEEVFFSLAIEDLQRAADLFRPIHEATNGVDGWASLEVLPLPAYDSSKTIAAAKELFARAQRPNLFIKIPGTREGLPAIEEAIFAGVPINVTLLFSREQYVAAAEAFLRGIERRIEAGLNPYVDSVASVFVSRWDTAVASKVPEQLRNQLGIAIAKRTYKAASALLGSPRWQRIYNLGGRPQPLLWASTGTKDPKASDVLYVKALAAPLTVDTMPEATLKALATHSEVGELLPPDGGNSEGVLAQFEGAGVDIDALAAQLQTEGAESFVKSWSDLMQVISSKAASLDKAGSPGVVSQQPL